MLQGDGDGLPEAAEPAAPAEPSFPPEPSTEPSSQPASGPSSGPPSEPTREPLSQPAPSPAEGSSSGGGGAVPRGLGEPVKQSGESIGEPIKNTGGGAPLWTAAELAAQDELATPAGAELAAVVASALAAPLVAWSLYTLKSTGACRTDF